MPLGVAASQSVESDLDPYDVIRSAQPVVFLIWHPHEPSVSPYTSKPARNFGSNGEAAELVFEENLSGLQSTGPGLWGTYS